MFKQYAKILKYKQ